MRKMPVIFLKWKLFISIILLVPALPNMAKAQNEPVVYQNWKMIGESTTHYEVSARVIKCNPDSAVQLHLHLFNEGVGAQTAHFNLTITDPASNETIVKEISYAIALGEFIIPSCDNNEHPLLRINLPSGWNAASVSFTLTFIP